MQTMSALPYFKPLNRRNIFSPPFTTKKPVSVKRETG